MLYTRGTWTLDCRHLHRAPQGREGDNAALDGADDPDPGAFEGDAQSRSCACAGSKKAGSDALKPRMWKAPVAQGWVALVAELLWALSEE